MKVRYRMFTDASKPLAGKIILIPETPEEHSALESFLRHVGSKQVGRPRLEIYYKWRRDNYSHDETGTSTSQG